MLCAYCSQVNTPSCGCSGLAIFTSGDIDHKLRMIFRTTDSDGSGKVEEEEMLKLFRDCYSMFYPGMSQSNIPTLVHGIFTRLEVDPSLGLSKCLTLAIFCQLLHQLCWQISKSLHKWSDHSHYSWNVFLWTDSIRDKVKAEAHLVN